MRPGRMIDPVAPHRRSAPLQIDELADEPQTVEQPRAARHHQRKKVCVDRRPVALARLIGDVVAAELAAHPVGRVPVALTPGEALRELLHDATEFMLGWDCITPLKAQLGEPFHALDARLQSAIDTRYRLPEWTPEAYAIHKRADGLAAASEAFHVVGWSRVDMRKTLRIAEVPLLDDPLSPCGFAPWEPWPPRVAQRLFIERFNALERTAPPSVLTPLRTG